MHAWANVFISELYNYELNRFTLVKWLHPITGDTNTQLHVQQQKVTDANSSKKNTTVKHETRIFKNGQIVLGNRQVTTKFGG